MYTFLPTNWRNMSIYRKMLFIILGMITLTVALSSYQPTQKYLYPTYNMLTGETQKQIDCLARNIYFEAGFEPADGQVAVALVTLNRVNDPRFPKDICSVVEQKTKSTCQFSWFCSPPPLKNTTVYNASLQVALWVYANYEILDDTTKGALYYHADYVNPRWKLEKTTVIGRHIFYKDYHDAKDEFTNKQRRGI
jgi:spore germination cell wall hydrolase CwlJ-like protein